MASAANRDASSGSARSDTEPRRRYVLVCRGPNCKAQGSTEVRERLAALLAAARESAQSEGDVVILPYTCFDRCGRGPNVVVYPDDVWYEAVSEGDVPDIARHALGGKPAEHLRADVPARHAAEYASLIEEVIAESDAEAINRKRPPKNGWWPFSR